MPLVSPREHIVKITSTPKLPFPDLEYLHPLRRVNSTTCPVHERDGCSGCKPAANGVEPQEVCRDGLGEFLFCSDPVYYASLDDASPPGPVAGYAQLLCVLPVLIAFLALLMGKRVVSFSQDWANVIKMLQGKEFGQAIKFTWLNFKLFIATMGLLSFLPWDESGLECSRNPCVYHEMFCEPTQHNSAFFRHPGNTWSNACYFVCALFGFWHNFLPMVDGGGAPEFYWSRLTGLLHSCNLWLLAAFSVLWHGTNCIEFHHWDLATMHGALLYYPLKFSATAFQYWRGKHSVAVDRAVFIVFVALCAGSWWLWKLSGLMDHEEVVFPTTRRRSFWMSEEELQTVVQTYCLLSGILLCPISFGVAFCGLECSWGGVMFIQLTVSIGWWVHCIERYMIDSFCNPSIPFMLSNTAIFHVLTGLGATASSIWMMKWEHQLLLGFSTPEKLDKEALRKKKTK